MIRKEAWLSCRTSSGVRLCWELEEPKGPKEQEGRGGYRHGNGNRIQWGHGLLTPTQSERVSGGIKRFSSAEVNRQRPESDHFASFSPKMFTRASRILTHVTA